MKRNESITPIEGCAYQFDRGCFHDNNESSPVCNAAVCPRLALGIKDGINARDALAKAADGLYDTVQDLRRVINGALRDDDSGPVLDDVMSRGRKHIKVYRAALAAAKGQTE